MNEANQKKPSNTSVIVRVGTKEWVVGEDSHSGVEHSRGKIVTLSGLEENLKAATGRVKNDRNVVQIQYGAKKFSALHFTAKISKFFHACYFHGGKWIVNSLKKMTNHSTVRESFQGGLIFGLIIGCASLMLFHQVNDTNSTSYMGFSKSIDSISPTTLTRTIKVPGIRAYGLVIGRYQTKRDAQNANQQFAKQGIKTITLQLNGYQLVSKIVLQQDDLRSDIRLSDRHGKKAAIVTISIPAKEYPALPFATVSNVYKTSAWLSSEVSALVVLDGWAMDGGRRSDGLYAFQNADHVYPGDTVISSTGLSAELGQFRDAVRAADTACAKGDKKEAERAVLNGYQILLNWQGLDIQT